MWKKILDNIKPILIVVGVLILLLFLNQLNITKKLKNEIKQQQSINLQNMAALNDTIQIYKNKADLNSYSKPIAEISSEDIKKYFPDLYQRLKNELGEVKIIWNTKIKYVDTGSVKNAIIQLDSNKFSLDYIYHSKDSSLYIYSTNTFFAEPKQTDTITNKYSVIIHQGISTINEISLKMGFTTGIKKENNLYKIFITPDSENITVTEIKGADVSNMLNPSIPPIKRWSIGPYIGYGIAFNKTSYTMGVEVGIGLQYSLFKF
jgi:hypothetical protein